MLQIVAHRLRSRADNALVAAAGVTTAQAAVLQLVASGDRPTQRQIAQQLRQNESAVTAMVRRLMKAGMLSRQPGESDARTWHLEITAAGRGALKDMRGPFAAINEMLDEATGNPADSARLAGYLTAIVAALDSEA